MKTKNRKFHWDETLERLFQDSKRVIVGKIKKGVRTFKMNRATGLATDYNEIGLFYFLWMQRRDEHEARGWSLEDYSDRFRFTSDSESRHAPVEETLALVYGLESCRIFILGCSDLLVTVDHLPLVKIFSDQALENIKNPACKISKKERWFQVRYRPGKLNLAPDCTSRYPVGTPNESPAQIIDTAVKAAFTSMYGSDHKLKVIRWERIVAATASDEECRTIAYVIQNGFPKSHNNLSPTVRVF